MKYWATKEGFKVKIDDMEDGHLVNALKMLRRHAIKQRNNVNENASTFGKIWAKETSIDEIATLMFEEYEELMKTAIKRWGESPFATEEKVQVQEEMKSDMELLWDNFP